MASTISLGFEVNDGNFRAALKAIDTEIRAMDEGIKAAAKEIETFGESEDASARRSELLTKMMDAQQSKLDALTGEYDKNVQKLGALKEALDKAKESGDPEAVAKATNAYNKQRIEVANLETQMSKTAGQIADTAAKMQEGAGATEDLGDKVEGLASKFDLQLAKQGITAAREALEGFVSAVTDAGKAVWGMASDASVFADDLSTQAMQTGISTQALQEYAYAARFVDTEVSTITGSITKLTKNMGSSSKDVAAAFDTLGVSATDSTGKMRDSETVFWELIDALGGVENVTERDQLAMALFGKSAQQLNPLIEAGSEAWNQYCTEAHEAGLILSDEGVDALGSFNDGLERIDATMDAAKNQIMAALAPAFETIATAVANAAQEFTKWVQTDEAQAMLAGITDTVIKLVNEMSGNLQPVIDAVKSGFSAASEAISFVIENSDMLMVAFEGLLAAMVALKIAEFAAAIAGLCNPIGLVVTAVVAAAALVVANWDKIKTAFVSAWETIKSTWSVCVDFFRNIWQSITNVFSSVKTWFGDLFSGAWQAVTSAWSVAGDFFTGIWETIIGVFKKGPDEMLRIGGDLVKGIWEGIKGMASWLWDCITNFASEYIAGPIKRFFGIQSPSKWMRDNIGVNLALGVAEGIMESADAVASAYRALIPDASELMSASDPVTVGSTVRERMTGTAAVQAVMLDDRPIILRLDDRELGRAVRGYV